MKRSYLIFLLLSISGFGHCLDIPSKGYDSQLSDLEYPFEPETFLVTTQGKALKMVYMYLPPQQNMPVITLMHGKNFTSAYWSETAEWLHKQGYGVLMPDQIGFGKSSKPSDYQYSFAGLAKNTERLLSKLNIDQTILIGHSMGGMLASRMALLYPDLVAHLILVNPIGLENYLQYVEYQDPETMVRQALRQTPESLIRYQRDNYYDGAWNDRYESLTLPLIGMMRGKDKAQVAKVNALTFDMIMTQPVIEEFKDFKMPVDLILGTRDRTAPGRQWRHPKIKYELGRYDRLGEAVQQRNPEIQVHPLAGLGHLPQIENPPVFQKILAEVMDQIKR